MEHIFESGIGAQGSEGGIYLDPYPERIGDRQVAMFTPLLKPIDGTILVAEPWIHLGQLSGEITPFFGNRVFRLVRYLS